MQRNHQYQIAFTLPNLTSSLDLSDLVDITQHDERQQARRA
jgi:hypothetical protein